MAKVMIEYTVVFWLVKQYHGAGTALAIHELDGFETKEDAETALHELRRADNLAVTGAVIARPYSLRKYDPPPSKDA